MPNTFLNLPAPAGNGVGTAVDASVMGPIKTIVRGGDATANVIIEINNAAVATDGTWAPVAMLGTNGQQTISVACRWMRVRVAGFNPYVGGSIEVDVGGADEAVTFVSLAVPAGNGVAASTDTSALGLYKSVHVGGTFRGTLIVEVSEDGSDWGQPFSFQTPGVQSIVVAAKYMRVRRGGVPLVSPGTPIVNVAAADPASGGGGVAVSAGTQLASTGTVSFANSNGVSFGMSNSSIVTASVLPETPFGVSAGTQSGSTGTMVLANSNGLSFGMAGSSQITGSYSQSTAPAAIGANTVSVSAGTVLLSNSNNVSFGMTGSTITASASFSQSPTPAAVSAGTQSGSTGTIVFSNSNNITFGMSGSSIVTASAREQSMSLIYPAEFQSATLGTFADRSMFVHPLTLPNHAVFSVLGLSLHFSGASNSTATGSFSASIGFYTQNGSSLSLLHSSSMTLSADHQGTNNSSLYNGLRQATTGWSSTVTRGQYWVGVLQRSASNGGAISMSQAVIQGNQGSTLSGPWGAASAASNQPALGYGFYSATLGALPASFGFSDINGTLPTAMRTPIYYLGSSV